MSSLEAQDWPSRTIGGLGHEEYEALEPQGMENKAHSGRPRRFIPGVEIKHSGCIIASPRFLVRVPPCISHKSM